MKQPSVYLKMRVLGAVDTALADLNRRKRLAERIPIVAETIVARKETVRQSLEPAVHLERKRVQLVVDPVTRVSEWKAGFVRPATGAVETQHKRVWRQVPSRIQKVVPERHVVIVACVPVEFQDELLVVRCVDIPLVRPRIVAVHRHHPIANRIHG